jgi:hypothetical protein
MPDGSIGVTGAPEHALETWSTCGSAPAADHLLRRFEMPVYELEILEPEGGVTRREYVSPEGVRYDVHESFRFEGRTLRVKLLEETDTGTDQRLVCVPD